MLADLYIYLGVALAGLVSFLSPCVLPLVPPYLGYLGGTTVSQMSGDQGVSRETYRRIVLTAVIFVLGFTTVFVGLGAGASVFGKFIQTYKAELSFVAGLVIVIFGLHFLGLLKIPLLYREARVHAEVQSASLLGAYVLGLAFAFGWTPCVGPVLATVLALAANEGSVGTGMRLLFVYSLGLGVPFILAAVAIRPFLTFMNRFKRHLGRVEKAMGLVLVLTGALFLAGTTHDWLARIAPAVTKSAAIWAWLAVLGGIVMVAFAVPIAARLKAMPERAAGLLGIALILGGFSISGGSINYLGQWLIENVPVLATIEEKFTSSKLPGEILKKGGQ